MVWKSQIYIQSFADFSEDELNSLGNSDSRVVFMYRTTKKSVMLRATDSLYTLEAEDFPEMAAILIHLTYKLTDHFVRMGVKDFKFSLKMTKELFKQITFKFLKSVETHAKDRMKLKSLEVSILTSRCSDKSGHTRKYYNTNSSGHRRSK